MSLSKLIYLFWASTTRFICNIQVASVPIEMLVIEGSNKTPLSICPYCMPARIFHSSRHRLSIIPSPCFKLIFQSILSCNLYCGQCVMIFAPPLLHHLDSNLSLDKGHDDNATALNLLTTFLVPSRWCSLTWTHGDRREGMLFRVGFGRYVAALEIIRQSPVTDL